MIAEVTASLVAELGIERVTMREVAQRGGFSKGVLQHYFADRAELLASALNWSEAQCMARIQAAAHREAVEGLAALQVRIENILPLTAPSLEEWKIRLQVQGLAIVDSQIRPLQKSRFQKVRRHLLRDIQRAIDAGEIKAGLDGPQVVRDVLMLITGLGTLAVLNPGAFSRAQLRRSVKQLIESVEAVPPRASATRRHVETGGEQVPLQHL
jgi:AcrR family transcriptional regulator